MRASRFLPLLLALWLLPATGFAFESLWTRVKGERELTSLFRDGEAVADVQGGFLIGQGRETWQRLPSGGMRILRSWTYDKARHPERGTIHKLPEPWGATSTLEVSSNLRLVRAETKLDFKRSADKLWPDWVVSEERPKMFDWNRSTTRADASGKTLTRTTYLNKERIDEDSYDYDPDAIPLEIATFYLSWALQRGLDRFDFELLLPGGSQHAIRAQVHRTKDLSPFLREYRLPRRYTEAASDFAVVDLRLAAVIKHAFFPHHIYMVYSGQDPTRIERVWGGDPDEPLQAFRVQ